MPGIHQWGSPSARWGQDQTLKTYAVNYFQLVKTYQERGKFVQVRERRITELCLMFGVSSPATPTQHILDQI